MPELPEVETLRRELNKLLKLDSKTPVKFTAIEFKRADLRNKIPKAKLINLIGHNLYPIQRRAKYLLFPTSAGTLLNHLGMTGNWRELKDREDFKNHDHAVIEFNNKVKLVYNDPRRFGIIDFVIPQKENESLWLKHLGAEPLSKEFNAEYFFAKIKKRVAPIKNIIMDQKIVVGVGNIYASEVLFKCHIHPLHIANKLSFKKVIMLVDAINTILKKAIDSGGTTIKDFRTVGGEKGYFVQKLKVYGRKGSSCHRCHKPIQAKKISGRSTYWCPYCQKK
ncbi:MAG: bifunctional DNA-formamidopyrimidine glycosylase/DNA-(apurinic or apyrimidinic site) lyase [Bdellovibrionaceae bacterium]|nr:bifunctional DNA-formamidopyrimidine glycosylase/DNA-(apurinic or apyrimidinic site) lyase [Pseudobdellovibrionaceae bacterium]